MSFDPRFTRDVVLPLAAAAYAVFDAPTADPPLPLGAGQRRRVGRTPDIRCT
jgi:hypothetical protein